MQRTYQLSEVAPTRAEGAMAELLRCEGRHQRFAAGALIQQRGDAGGGFWLIEQGTVSICRFGMEGAVTVFGVLGAGDLFGELAHFTGLPRQVDAVADTDAVLVRIEPLLIERLLDENPNFARWLLKSLGNQLRTALDRIERDRNLPASSRIVRLLLDLANREGPRIAITHQALGELLGLSRVTVGQVLGELAKTGLLRPGYRQIVVTDLAQLRQLLD